jgi:nucleotide-binding universal stress UspA family protein
MTVAEQTLSATPKTDVIFRHILVATDFSDASWRALGTALALGAEYDSRVTVVHVLQPDRRYTTLECPPELDLQRMSAEQQFKKISDECGSADKVDTTLLKHGPVPAMVASLIEQEGIDLLVIGTRGRGGLQKLALGSVAEELLRVAQCPVLTIGPKAALPKVAHRAAFHRILFATEFGKASAKALPVALTLAKAAQAKLILLHMFAPMPGTSGSLSAYAPAGAAADEFEAWEGASRKQILQHLKECLPAETGLQQEPEFVVGTDFLPEGILTAVDKFQVDLIVMGANKTGSARAAAHIPWATTHEVIRNAPCPVLTVAG